MEKLNMCPFCGGTTRMKRVKLKELHGMYYVRCACCGSQTGLFPNKDDAINVWNHRDQLAMLKYEIIAMQQDIILAVNKEINKRVNELIFNSPAWHDNPGEQHLN